MSWTQMRSGSCKGERESLKTPLENAPAQVQE